jgi:hypothetical protein
VLFVGGGHQLITTNAWPAFAAKQIKLLVAAGISESVARSYYADLPDRSPPCFDGPAVPVLRRAREFATFPAQP